MSRRYCQEFSPLKIATPHDKPCTLTVRTDYYDEKKLCTLFSKVDPLSTNHTKWSNTLKQFIGYCRQIALVYLTILWGWRLKG